MRLRKVKNRIAMLVVILMLVSFMPANSFSLNATDDYSSHWASKTIQEWISKGYISGYSDGSFRPDGEITRAEFITLINTAFGYEKTMPISFKDVKEGDWFYNQIMIGVGAGYITGYPDKSIRPNNPITREEAAAIIARSNSLKSDESGANIFKDASGLTWGKGFVGAVYSANIMSGYPDGYFRPQMLIKRSEAVVALNEATKHREGQIIPTPNQGSGSSGDKQTIAPQNPIDVVSVLESNGIDYLIDGDTIFIGNNNEIKMTAATTSAIFDGVSCTLPYAPEISKDKIVINPDFFKKFFNATYDKGGAIVIPEYVKTLLQNDFASKSEIYQSKVTGEEEFLSAIDWETGWNTALELGLIGSSAKGWGFRTGGTEEGLEAASLIKDKFEDLLGADAVGSHQFNLYAWRYIDSSLTLMVNDETISVPAISAVGTKATDSEGVLSEVVDIGKATKQDFAALKASGIDLKGKIALIASDLDYVPWQSQACYSAEQNGAIGVIYYCHNYYAQYEDGSNGQTAFNVQDWSGTEIDIPVLNISKKDGLKLKSQVAEGVVEATIVSNVEIVEDSDKGLNVYAVIEGSKYPDEYVMVNAHTDAYFTGFQDDSIAVGAMVSYAEAFVKSGIQPERSVILLSTDAEEFGVMGIGPDWLVGSWLLMKDNSEAQKWKGKIVASLTLELMAYAGADKFEMRACDTLFEYIMSTAQGFDYRGHDNDNKDISGFDGLGIVKNEISNMSDEFTMARYGVPTFRTNTHSKVVSDIYHTQFDTPDTTSEGKYDDCLKYYGTYLIRLCNADVAPYDLTKTADKYIQEVDFDYIDNLGYKETLHNQAKNYQANAREIYLKNSLILKLMNYAKQNSIDTSAISFNKYNKNVRDATVTIIAQSTHLAGESTTLEIPYYIKLIKTLTNGLASMDAGKGPESQTIFSALPARYYTDYLEYDAWYETNVDNINLGKRDVLWANDIKVKYLDIYEFYQNIKQKSDGDNFDDEIATANAWLVNDAIPHLSQAILDDIDMFNTANTSLNIAKEEADKLIKELLILCELD